MKELIKQNLIQASSVLHAFLEDDENISAIERAARLMIESLDNGHQIITCGNGGSMCDAMHFASELTGRYREDRAPMRAVAISDVAHMTCVSNDFDYSRVFARWIRAHAGLHGDGKTDDVLLAISTSGNSENVFTAVQEAHRKGMRVVYLSGNNGGSIRDLMRAGDVEINVPHHVYSDRIQEVHIKIIHILVGLIERGLQL